MVLIATCILVDALVTFKIWRIIILQRINNIDDPQTANVIKGRGIVGRVPHKNTLDVWFFRAGRYILSIL